MVAVPDLSGAGLGSDLVGKLTFDNVTTQTIAAAIGKRIRIADIVLTLDAAGTITITDGTTPIKFKLTAAGAMTLDRIRDNGAYLYSGASGAAVTISASAGNLSGFLNYVQR